MSLLRIQPAGPGEVADWVRLRGALWSEPDAAAHRAEVCALLGSGPAKACALLAYLEGEAVGFAEAELRSDYVNGCDTTPVAFLEGLYVAPARRRRGVARALVEATADCARALGLGELASDTALDNAEAQGLHLGLGFEETERVVFFRRALVPP